MRRDNTLSATIRAGLLAGTATLLSTTTVTAAADPGIDTSGLETVVVTAEKHQTDLQVTPIAISVLDEKDMARRHILSLRDLSDGSIPSLHIVPMGPRNSALTIAMRGIGALADANQPARDQAVGIYIDGVYLGRAQGLGSAMYDIDHVEVLRGPQGTLFGRNTEGGAISIVTKAPTGVFDMETTLGYGNYGAYDARVHVDLPRFHDVSIKVSGLLSKRGGTIKNPTTSGQPDFDSYDKRGFQGEAMWQPVDDFSATYAYDYSYDASTPYYMQLLTDGSLKKAPLMPLQIGRAKVTNLGVPMQPSVGITSGHRLNLDWNITDSLELKSITSYRDLSQTQYDNGEMNLSIFTPNANFSRYSLAMVYQNQYSEELQVIGKAAQFDYVGGVFFFHEHAHDNAQTPNSLQWNATGTGYTTLSLDLNTIPYDRASHVTTESYGVFGQVVWTPAMLDNIAHLTLGGRLTRDSKDGDLDVVNGKEPSYKDPNGKVIDGIIGLKKSWTHFDPLVNLGADITPDVHVYGKWSTGYKAGGANSRSLTYRAFQPESVSMFEIGAKTEFWDNRARLNVAAYSGTLKDAQVDFSVVILNNNRGTLETMNAAKERTQGVEADLTVEPIDGLTFNASYAYDDVSLSQAHNPFTNTDVKIYPLFTPKNSASIAADYEHPLFGATFSAHLDANYADGAYTGTTDPTMTDAYLTLNGQLAISDIRLDSQTAALQLSLWVRNLTDEEHTFSKSFNASLGTHGIYNEPRMFGVEARFTY